MDVVRQGRSEPLGADEGEGEVDEEPGRHEGAEGEVEGHGGASEAFAERGVTGGQAEEGKGSCEEDDVEHDASRVRSAPRARTLRDRTWADPECGREPR
ncbi:hypothetical protein JCM2811A_06940 [Methylorubrum rhodinum]